MKNYNTLAWIVLVIGFLMIAGVISANFIVKIIGTIILIAAGIYIWKNSNQ